MNRGCVAVGQVECDSCQHLIDQGDRYLLMEQSAGKRMRVCVDCCLKKGHAAYVKEKGEEVLTFFPIRTDSEQRP